MLPMPYKENQCSLQEAKEKIADADRESQAADKGLFDDLSEGDKFYLCSGGHISGSAIVRIKPVKRV